MEYKYFYDKYIEDLNKEELIWVYKNSHIDIHTFNARMIQFEENYTRSKHLVKDFPFLKEIEDIYFNDFQANRHYLIGMDIYEKLFRLYKQISYRFNIITDNFENSKELISIYKMVYDIQESCVKDFYSYIGIYLKKADDKYLKKLVKPICDIDDIWRLRPNFVIRDLNIWKEYIENPNNSSHRSKQLISYAMVLVEHREYKKARDILEEVLFYFNFEIDKTDNYVKRYASIYYNLYINYLLKDKNEFEKIYNKYYNVFSKAAYTESEIMAKFKLTNINYMLYDFDMITREIVIKENIKIYNSFFRSASDRIKKSVILNNFPVKSYRHEHIGEVLMNYKSLHNFIYHGDYFYYI